MKTELECQRCRELFDLDIGVPIYNLDYHGHRNGDDAPTLPRIMFETRVVCPHCYTDISDGQFLLHSDYYLWIHALVLSKLNSKTDPPHSQRGSKFDDLEIRFIRPKEHGLQFRKANLSYPLLRPEHADELHEEGGAREICYMYENDPYVVKWPTLDIEQIEDDSPVYPHFLRLIEIYYSEGGAYDAGVEELTSIFQEIKAAGDAAIPVCIELLKLLEGPIAIFAAMTLNEFKPTKEMIVTMLDCLDVYYNTLLNDTIEHILVHWGTSVVPHLIQRLETRKNRPYYDPEGDPIDHDQHLRVLGQIHDKSAFEYLVKLVRTQPENIDTSAVIEALGRQGDPAAIPILRQVAERTTNYKVEVEAEITLEVLELQRSFGELPEELGIYGACRFCTKYEGKAKKEIECNCDDLLEWPTPRSLDIEWYPLLRKLYPWGPCETGVDRIFAQKFEAPIELSFPEEGRKSSRIIFEPGTDIDENNGAALYFDLIFDAGTIAISQRLTHRLALQRLHEHLSKEEDGEFTFDLILRPHNGDQRTVEDVRAEALFTDDGLVITSEPLEFTVPRETLEKLRKVIAFNWHALVADFYFKLWDAGSFDAWVDFRPFGEEESPGKRSDEDTVPAGGETDEQGAENETHPADRPEHHDFEVLVKKTRYTVFKCRHCDLIKKEWS